MFLSTDTSQQAHYAQVPSISHSRNAFTVARRHITTMQFDKLTPLYYDYIEPGDTLSATFTWFARLATQKVPLMDDLYIDAHAWFCPKRILQTNWARFMFNAQPTGPTQDNSSLTTPKYTLTALTSGWGAKTLFDYMGDAGDPEIPLDQSVQHINTYLGRAINHTWNLNYRDQNLQDAVHVDFDDGPDDPADYATLLPRGKRHDKFTSLLTAQQKGPASTIALGTTAPVSVFSSGALVKVTTADDAQANRAWQVSSSGNAMLMGGTNPGSTKDLKFGNESGLEGTADLSFATTVTINALRTSVAVQHLLEADARGGTRDVESLKNRWGVTVPDFRIDRPEYLGGATYTFDGHIVPQTSESGDTPQATLTQFSQMMGHLNINHSFLEHGVFFILLSARSNQTYQQGLARHLSYRTRFDYNQPEFANLGEVGVKLKEIFFQGDDGTDDDSIFGYQEYGYQLRYKDNIVSSEMRSSFATSKDSYHMAYDFGTKPELDDAYIQSATPIDRNIVVASSVADPIEINSIMRGSMARTLPMFSIPGLDKL